MDREELAQVVDRLIAQKPIKASNEQEAAARREELMGNLDRSIRLSILNRLTDEQLDEFDHMLDRDEDTTEDEYERFFQRAGVDLPETVKDVTNYFAQTYLGGADE